MSEKKSDMEYTHYLAKLRSKNIYTMNYSELSDLAVVDLEEACTEKNWEKLRTGLRLLILATNCISGKADAVKIVLKEHLEGKK